MVSLIVSTANPKVLFPLNLATSFSLSVCLYLLNLVFISAGIRALNKTHISTAPASVVDNVHFVTVFTLYNATRPETDERLVTVGNASYTKLERSMAILNIFVNFIQVL